MMQFFTLYYNLNIYSTKNSFFYGVGWWLENCACAKKVVGSVPGVNSSQLKSRWIRHLTSKCSHAVLYFITSFISCLVSAPKTPWWSGELCIFFSDTLLSLYILIKWVLYTQIPTFFKYLFYFVRIDCLFNLNLFAYHWQI